MRFVLTAVAFVALLDDLLSELLATLFEPVIGRYVLYPPGFVLVRAATVGRYPPEYDADEGRVPCILIGLVSWAGGVVGLVIALT